MARRRVDWYRVDADGTGWCCDNPLVVSDGSCGHCGAVTVWDADGAHLEREVTR